ncbi:MAG: Gfo/Idh/MocA family protein, partial [Planctomycetota bacterium]
VVAEVQASWVNSPKRMADNWPQSDHITWIFPGNERTAADEFTLEWFDGEFYPPAEIRELAKTANYPGEAAMVIGTDGAMLLPHGSAPQLLPRERFLKHPRPTLPPRNHYHHFVDACLGGEKTESHFTQTGPMTEAILLGTVAIRTPGQRLEWDAASMRFPNAPHADQYIRRTYRPGWEVKGL